MDIVIAPSSLSAVKENIRLKNEKPYEADGKRKDGTIFTMEVHAKQITYQGHNVRVAAIRDISEHKKIIQKFEKNLDMVERMNELMVGRELKMIELKERIRTLEGGEALSKKESGISWKEKFKEGEELEEIFVTKIKDPYTQEIDKSDLDESIKDELKRMLNILISDSTRHLNLFKEMEEKENG